MLITLTVCSGSMISRDKVEVVGRQKYDQHQTAAFCRRSDADSAQQRTGNDFGSDNFRIQLQHHLLSDDDRLVGQLVGCVKLECGSLKQEEIRHHS